ncbi:hypothetical protein [Acinetobacter brisouii]
MFSATQILKIKNDIKFLNISDLIQDLGVAWGDLGFFENPDDMLKNADDSFLNQLKPVFKALSPLEDDDFKMINMMLEKYFLQHPVRNYLLKIIADKKLKSMEMEPIRMVVTQSMLANPKLVYDEIVRKIDIL